MSDVAELAERWARRLAWGSDGRRAVAKLDLSQGRFAGAELLIVAELGRVSVRLDLPPAAADDGLAQRLRSRLEERGLAADVVVR